MERRSGTGRSRGTAPGTLTGTGSGSGTRRGTRSRLAIIGVVATTCFGAMATSLTAADAAPVATPARTSAPASRVRESDPMSGLAQQAVAALEASQEAPARASTMADYPALRAQIASEVASRLEIDPARMIAAWQSADMPHQLALMAALSQLGVPYRHNTSRAGEGFDCSGLTTYAWGVAGTTLTRQSGSQIRNAAKRTADTAMAGDIVYYPGHVMLWLGVDTAIVHAPYTGRNVQVDTIAKRGSMRFGNPIG